MRTLFTDWKDAHTHAQERANATRCDVAIRAAVEYGRKGFYVTLACRMDSDYALAEIVTPVEVSR